MYENTNKDKRYAVLIDTENISAKYVDTIFRELSEYGYSTYRRAYGNWSRTNGWNQGILLDNSILPVQQFDYTSRKNSTDMAMVIDAMDILHSGKVDGFCLITSDSDFTRLAMKLREENMHVIGMGESKVPVSLAKSCNKFIYLDIIYEHNGEEELTQEDDETLQQEESITASGRKEKKSITPMKEIENAINDILIENNGETVGLGQMGSQLSKLFSDFDVRNYGYAKLSTFVKDGLKNVELVTDGKGLAVAKKNFRNKKTIEAEIIKLLKENGGKVNNLSVIHEHLKKVYPNFNIKDYGYGKISTFIKSIDSVKINGNIVTLKH